MAAETAPTAVSVEVRIGHVVLPESRTAAYAQGPVEEPAAKRARAELQPPSQTLCDTASAAVGDVVHLTAWTVPAIQHALRQYAVAVLRSMTRQDGRDDAAALEAVTTHTSGWAASWPSVVLSPPAVPQEGGWGTMSFSFVPGALTSTSPLSSKVAGSDASASSLTSSLDAATWELLNSLPLPRGVCLDLSAASDGSDDVAGCAACVLTEKTRVRLPAAIAGTARSPSVVSAPTSSPGLALPAAAAADQRAQPILLVGAGGIGCELLKVLVLSGFTHIHLIDLDTIDATNLNRQFLFQTCDVGHSKAETARRVVLSWFSEAPPSIVAYHDNVKSERYDDDFYSQFAVVLNALDNVSARQHVNRMCMRNAIPLIESGTMGYNGQVQPILKDRFECYDCRPKPPDTKTFAVCTIHARPTTMVHCVHYAKELYEVLFGVTAGASNAAADDATPADQGEQETKAAAPADGELTYLRVMVSKWRSRQSSERVASSTSSAPSSGVMSNGSSSTSSSSSLELAAALLRLLFVTKVTELLAMKSTWSTEPPTPLDLGDLDAVVATAEARTSEHGAPASSLSVDHALPVTAYMELFLTAVQECIGRADGLAFRKEDDAAVRFVSAASNLRAHVFHIPVQSLEEVRSIAGSIVPAIATTNAIIAAAVVHEMMTLLHDRNGAGDTAFCAASTHARVVYARRAPQSRRRRLPQCCAGAGAPSALSPSLFLEYGGTSPTSGVSWQTATSLVGTPCTSAALPSLPGATRSAARAKRAVTDLYLVHSTLPNPPNRAACLVCQDVHPEVGVCVDWHTTTVGVLAHAVLEAALGLEGPSISHGATVLYEEGDYEALEDYSLADVLQLPTTPETASGVARCTLTVDALNKDVAWHLRLTHAAAAAPLDGCDSATVHFDVTGLDRALAAEVAALARQAAAAAPPQLPAHEGGGGTTTTETVGSMTRAALGQNGETAVEVVVSDEEDDDVVEAVAPSAGSGTAAPGTSVAAKDAEEDEALVVD